MSLLWSGTRYPTSSQIIRPTLPITECMNGWVLERFRYNVGSVTSDIQFHYTLIPKSVAQSVAIANSYSLLIPQTAATNIHKYLYFSNNELWGAR